jgi:hypothetical protein
MSQENEPEVTMVLPQICSSFCRLLLVLGTNRHLVRLHSRRCLNPVSEHESMRSMTTE